MNETSNIIKLIELTNSENAFGNDEGREVFQKLAKKLDEFPSSKIFGISLEGIKRTDASFPRESIISLAKSKRGEKGFFLLDISGEDLLDNWHYAAKAKEQPMIVFSNGDYQVIGPSLSAGASELLSFIMQEGRVTSSMIVNKFGGSPQNASGRLKKLHTQGLVMSTKEVAESGGIEFVYTAIRRSV